MSKVCDQNKKPVLRKIVTIIVLPFGVLVFVALLPIMLIFIIWVVISGSFQSLVTNSRRWFNGKTPKLYCLSKDCLTWSRTEAAEAAQRAINQFESLAKQIDTEWPGIFRELSKETLTMIKEESTSSKDMHDLCKRIREVPKIKGINDIYLLHDWLLEKADNNNGT